MIQDHHLNYWISTNEGLYLYDNYAYQKIECEESKSISYFNFVISDAGTIFCNNLNNQIFKIQNKSCNLIYELRPQDAKSDLYLTTGSQNELIITGKSLIVIDSKGREKTKYPVHYHYCGKPFQVENGSIHFSLSTDSIVVYDNFKFNTHQLHSETELELNSTVLHFFELDSILFALNMKTKKLFYYYPDNFELKPSNSSDIFLRSESVRIYQTDDMVWVAGTLPGVTLIKDASIQTNYPIFYSNTFISDIYKDKEGNYLLCTFDEGIYVISDLEEPDVFTEFNFKSATTIVTDNEFGTIIGTSTGEIVKYADGEFTLIHEGGKRAIECIVNDENSEYFIFDDGNIRAFHKSNGHVFPILEASLKDGAVVDPSTFYLSTNVGLAKVQINSENSYKVEWQKKLQIRNYAIEYNSSDQSLIVSTVNGLFKMDTTENINEIKWNGMSMAANKISISGGSTFVSLTNGKLLEIDQHDVIREIELTANGTKLKTFDFCVNENSIFANTNEGLLQFDRTGNFVQRVDQQIGQQTPRVLNFHVNESAIWISTPDGLRKTNIFKKDEPLPQPHIFIADVLVNDNRINPYLQSEFESKFKKFQFVLTSPTLKFQNQINYHYRLIGYEENWNIQSYPNRTVTYNALAPGDYIFEVKAENQTVFSETLTYTFHIATPFYMTWGFILCIVIIFLLIVYWIYIRQLNIQKTKARQINELNASKLTAIQSQMNPHFIFNSLNSIQDLVLKGDVENSYSYITTFSNLVRRTLNYSDKEYIDFEQEIKLIELYLSLEKLRFKKEFEYILQTNGITDIQIPPMLIQPFIENALVHGLLHKKGTKKLLIQFELNDHLICIIEDNGIGRDEAAKIASRQKKNHESFAVDAIHKRFEILRHLYPGSLGYRYEDLTENNTPCGTRVVVTIPVRHKF